LGVVLDSMRGRVFITRFQSRLTEPHDGWPAMRTELTAIRSGEGFVTCI
jgi:hypothetical protein